MRFKHVFLIPLVGYIPVGFSVLTGHSEGAGLFGAIVSVGLYIMSEVKGSQP